MHWPSFAAFPQAAHHVVQSDAVVAHAMLAQTQIKTKRYQSTFGVVTDCEVGAVGVLQVILGPRFKTRLRHGMHFAPRRLQHLVDGFIEQTQILRIVYQA